MSDQIWWYATRAAGLMTWSTAVASVIVGLILVIPPVKKRVGDWFHDLHRYLGSVSVIFLVAHLGSLYLDSVAGFGIRELLIPGESTWEPSAAAWGVVAAWSLVAVQLTSLVRKHISDFVWRGIHVVAVLTVVAGTYHAWLGGTDVDNPITWSIAGLGSVLVVALIAVRLRRTDEGPVDGEERLSDREALLTEMRERLENLPIPEPPASPQITLEAAPTLPRRSPTTVAASSPLDDAFPPEPGPITADTAFSSDPFAAMPLGADNPELSEWVGRSTSDPFEQPPVDPFRNNAPGPGDNLGLGARPSGDPFSQPRPFTEQTPSNPFTEPTGANPFPEIEPQPPFTEPAPANPFTDSPPANPFTDSPPANPFTESASPDSFVEPAVPAQDPWPAPSSDAATLGQLPVSEPAPTHQPPSPYGSEAPPVPPMPTPAPAASDADLFGPATDGEERIEPVDFPELPPIEPGSNPFGPVDPPTNVISVPVEPSPQPGPPPLPVNAVDPATGKPDEAAYSAWLVEWLAYAERYGEETPEDPNRI